MRINQLGVVLPSLAALFLMAGCASGPQHAPDRSATHAKPQKSHKAAPAVAPGQRLDWPLLPAPRQADINTPQPAFELAPGDVAVDGNGLSSEQQEKIRRFVLGALQSLPSRADKAAPQASVKVDAAAAPHAQGYDLAIGPSGVRITAHDEAGVFYAAQTIRQIAQQARASGVLPLAHVVDWPDFPNRGVMLDVARDKVPEMETLYALVDKFASWKLNQLQLYTEHTFSYRNHPTVWQDASPMTAHQIQELDKYCRERYIELVPNQNSFGHMGRWLQHPQYKHLGEMPGGGGDLCPVDPDCVIIMNHKELIPELPKDVVAMEWGYEAKHPFLEHGKIFASSGISYYVVPGTSSWNSLVGRTDNAVANLRNAGENGLANGAIGYLITDWGDGGHWQCLPISYLGFAYGAAVSWCVQTNAGADIPRILDAYAFEDEAGVMGKLAYDLGNAYQKTGITPGNNTTFYGLLLHCTEKPFSKSFLKTLSAKDMEETLAYVDEVMARLPNARMKTSDAQLIRDEFAVDANLARFACHLGIARAKAGGVATSALPRDVRSRLAAELAPIIPQYRQLWLARNRSGGLKESAGAMENLLALLKAN
ncbi:MAG: family 20 glycosylhydrolase [Candidatus Hydrogenedentes bacterium]|nr:family 20 glycosylhydrolase [Candidatus Hydrogenedentota bacterium]